MLYFSGIKDKGLILRQFDPQIHDDETALGHFLKMVPNKDLKSYEITWPQLPPVSKHWRCRALNYISHCIGHEGENSLLSELIRQDLVQTCNTS